MEAISKVLDKCPETDTSPPLLLPHHPDGEHTYVTPKLSKAGWARSHSSCMQQGGSWSGAATRLECMGE